MNVVRIVDPDARITLPDWHARDIGKVSRVICILGMHRSGTSCLAGTLEEAGVVLGPVNTAAMHNRKGNREDSRIWTLHDTILHQNGGTWADPPDSVRWTDANRAERDGIIASHAQEPLWGFKDPRTLLMFDFWRKALPDAMLIGTFRHPQLVADSLVRREGRDAAHWLGLWLRYNSALLRLHTARPFPIIRFDADDDDYRQSLAAAIQGLGIGEGRRPGFFEPALRHNCAVRPAEPPAQVMALYDALCHIAVGPDHATG